MATLSGNKIKDTYQSLVKFSDNGNITTSAKQLTDGFGNNAPVWVSTTQVGIGVTPESGLNLHVFGDAKIGSNLTVIGNLVVEGSTTTVGTDTLTVKDPLIVLANNNTSTDAVDIGFYGKYTPSGTTLYSGLFREALTGKYRLFKGLEDEPTTTVNTGGTGYAVATLISNLEGTLTGVIASTTTATTQSANDNSTKVATTAYVDNQVGLYDTLSEVLANGNTTGGTDIAVSTGDDITFATDSKAIFGASNQLQIYYNDTTESNIYSSGLLYLQSDDLRFNSTAAETMATFTANGAVELFYDAQKKFETTDTGVSVTGRISGLTDPTLAQDAATKGYVDAAVEGQDTLAEILAIGNTTGGTDIAVSANDDITFADNSKIILGAGSDLEIYSDGTDNYITQSSGTDLIFTIGSSEMIRIQSGGDMSISEPNPGNSSRFYVNGFGYSTAGWAVGTSTGTFVGQITSLGNKLQIKSQENNDIQIGDATSLNIIHIDTSEDSVGINLTNPSDYTADELVISVPDESGMTLVSATTHSAYISFADTTGTDSLQNYIKYDHNDERMWFNNFGGNMYFSTGEANVEMTILSTGVRIEDDFSAGNLGDPYLLFADVSDAKVYVEGGLITSGDATFGGSINAGVSTFNSDGGGTALKFIARLAGETSVLRFYANDGTTQNAWIGSSNSNFDINSVANYPLTFRTNDTLALTIDTSQNATFAGSVKAISYTGNAYPYNGEFLGGADVASANLQAGSTSGYATGVKVYGGGNATPNIITMTTASVERMLIDSSGNVGINQTPSTTSSYMVALQIGEQANLFGHTTGVGVGSATYLSNNITHNDGYKYINADAGSIYVQASGAHSFSSFVAGTAGAAATEQVRMRITNGGNVGIGTDSPQSTLHVDGDIRRELDGTSTIGFGSGSTSAWYSGIKTVDFGAQNIGLTLFTTTNAGTTNVDALTIDEDGNVGIGTDSPSSVGVGGTPTVLQINNSSTSVAQLVLSNQSTADGAVPAVIDFASDALSGTEKRLAEIWATKGDASTSVATGSLSFATNNAGTLAERMRITSGGDLLVGATALSDVGSLTQSHLLEGNSESAGTGAVGVYNNSGTANCPSLVVLNRDESTDSSNRFIQFYANVIGGTNTPMGGIVGNGASNVQFAALSDIREKENIKTIESSLNKISKLNPVEFDWKKSGEHINAGFIAQEVEEVFPEYVIENISNEGEEERKGLTGGMTSGIVAHLVKSIQELKAEIESLKQQINN